MPTYPERRAAAIAKAVKDMRKRKRDRHRIASYEILRHRDLGMSTDEAYMYLSQHDAAFERYQQLYPGEASAAEFDGAVADEIIQRLLRAERESRISGGVCTYDKDAIIEFVIGRESPVMAAKRRVASAA